jgi:mannose-1-phosphate guanylyltransferase
MMMGNHSFSSVIMVAIAILCGGVGSRLWPVSRKSKPKQFMKLPNSEWNLFQQTVLRVNEIELKPSEIIIVSSLDIRSEIQDAIAGIQSHLKVPVVYLWEPVMRNTGPALASLLTYFNMTGGKSQETCIVYPSDHLISMTKFNQSLTIANQYVHDHIITFGITPTHPETGYGYIKSGDNYQIEKFIEKPQLEVAMGLLQQGQWLWNSGMFYFRVGVLRAEYEHLAAQLLEQVETSFKKGHIADDYSEVKIDKESYLLCPSQPFDKMIMEKTEVGKVVPFDGRWSDIGSWESICELDQAQTNDIQIDCKDSQIISYNPRQHVSLIGLDGVCVVNTSDAILICAKSQTQKVKDVYQKLEAQKSQLVEKHQLQEFAWGTLETLDQNSNYQLLKCQLLPGQKTHEFSKNLGHKYLFALSGTPTLVGNSADFENPIQVTIQVRAQKLVIRDLISYHIENLSGESVTVLIQA